MHFALLTAYAVVTLLFLAVASTTLVWMLHAWQSPDAFEETDFPAGGRAADLSFSLIVPARHEEGVLGATLDRLAALRYDRFEVLAVVGHDDPGTAEVARAAAERNRGRVRVLVDTNSPKNKPKALNTALPACRGDVVGVFDAEDVVHPDLLRRVSEAFDATGAHIVQGAVQLVNYRDRWYSVRNCLEYFFWFRSRLHFHAGQHFVPLGGNTVFISAPLLHSARGWDPECLAEDCELGARLTSLGARVAVACDPELATREETPATLRELARQRSRWNQGFLQVLGKGDWRRLPRRERALARFTLAQPFLQAFTGVLMPFSIASIVLLSAPVGLALISFAPLLVTLTMLGVEVAGLREFCRHYGRRPRALDYARLILGTFPYQLVLAYAAVRAAWRHVRGRREWEKTAHVGAHLEPVEATG
jgi:cellulose synthase/poly-beta-1,6-N-acetylglucosamine synthase-like glycosyltransferase